MKNIKGVYMGKLVKYGSLFCIAVLAGCQMTATELVRIDSDRVVNISRGTAAKLEFEANPSTGYSWELAKEEPKGVIRITVEPEYLPKRTRMVGSGGVQVFAIKGVKAGAVELEFTYRRPWEEAAAFAKKYRVTVNVK